MKQSYRLWKKNGKNVKVKTVKVNTYSKGKQTVKVNK
jgi:hypothetical protein